ncbi:hypothetical protein [Thiohalocapsa sp.]|jgi:hypothetical protein|uniref:hypothetical protein n=1 Tax=Thiohalocapsa sp. TaxID=2497641 RepID=UPI0025E632F3|nr:hypothetical protein [Thiohalocapsa sp.]
MSTPTHHSLNHDASADATSQTCITDLYPFRRYAREVWEPQGLGTEHALRWLVRHRHTNGLLACGAVIEKRPTSGKRPLILIHGRRFARWLATSDEAA